MIKMCKNSVKMVDTRDHSNQLGVKKFQTLKCKKTDIIDLIL
jgi:hypothetical protein